MYVVLLSNPSRLLYSEVLNQHRMLNLAFNRLAIILESPIRNRGEIPVSLVQRGKDEFHRNLKSIYWLACSVDAELVLFSQPTLHDKEQYDAGYERIGYSILYPSYKQYTEIMEQYTSVLQEFAQEHEYCKYVPMRETFADQRVDQYFSDTMHYTDEGIERFVSLALPHLITVLDGREDSRPE